MSTNGAFDMHDTGTLDKLPAEPACSSLRGGLVSQLYPHHWLSGLMRHATRIRYAPVKNRQIRWFIRHYGVDMRAAQQQDPARFADFNDFFTRAVRPEARSIASSPGSVVAPADGSISQMGDIQEDRIMQVKGCKFTLARLLGGMAQHWRPFRNGQFITIYLSPKDYHRVHLPVSGRLRAMTYVPGRLFSVSPATTRNVRGLFVRNERVISLFDTVIGPMAIVMVGAIFVGSIETVWHGTITPAHPRRLRTWSYGERPHPPSPTLERGEEMGRFNMGSTVLALFAGRHLTWSNAIGPENEVRMGQQMAVLNPMA